MLTQDDVDRDARAAPVPAPYDEEEQPGLHADMHAADRVARRTDLARAISRLKPRERAMLWTAIRRLTRILFPL